MSFPTILFSGYLFSSYIRNERVGCYVEELILIETVCDYVIEPPPTKEWVDENGIKTIESYKWNLDHQLIKTTKRVKVVKTVKYVHRRVAERMHIIPFGIPNGGNEGVTVQSQDQIFFEKPNQHDKIEKQADSKRGTLCRICKGNHIVAHCPNRGQEEPVSSTSLYMPKEPVSSTSLYMPKEPSSLTTYRSLMIRDRISFLEEEKQFTVRINNLADDVSERDLSAMLSRIEGFGRSRIPKGYDTGKPRGYAYAYFRSKEGVEEVIRMYNGYALHHLILEVVPWEKKTGGRTFRTGYGKVLPQNAKR